MDKVMVETSRIRTHCFVSGPEDGVPVLLVTSGSVPSATRTALLRMKPTRIVALGGSAPVSETVATVLVELGHDPARVKTERFGPTGG